jgi:hypothetical protein
MEWRTVKSSASTKPDTIDTTSSKAVVYVRKDIQRITVKEPGTSVSVEMWEYKELIFPKDIWNEIGELVVENSIREDDHSSSIENLESLTLGIFYQQTLDELDV